MLRFGTITLDVLAPNNDAEQRQIIFDPIPRVDGIEPSGDPLLELRKPPYTCSADAAAGQQRNIQVRSHGAERQRVGG